ncbi:SDR family oxidoreductase [Actinocorallia aurantiaca]|uniref:SDR family oxidoreductase n=1 Tax=Actinocorallia aurantiaca TaxID=46204 RepID=A0ABN3TV48_9ACTN
MRLTVFGATGGTGQHLVRQALDAGHHVTAVVRNPGGLPRHPLLETVVADVMDSAVIGPALTGRDAVVSALGPRGKGETTVCSDGARSISTAMRAAGGRRLIVVTASGHIVDEGDGPFTRNLVKPLLGRFLREAFADFVRTEQVVRDSGLDWTLMRPPRLTDGDPRPYRTAVDRNVRGGITLARADLAHAILNVLDDSTTVGRTVALGY